MNPPDKDSNGDRIAVLPLTGTIREVGLEQQSLIRAMFMGELSLDRILAISNEPHTSRAAFQQFFVQLKKVLQTMDYDDLDPEGNLTAGVLQPLAAAGIFGMNIPPEYGGLGLSRPEFNQVMKLIASYDTNLTAFITSHQLIGVSEPLKLFGTAAQKQRYLTQIANGAVSTFALIDHTTSSDPSQIGFTVTTAAADGYYLLNGSKQWLINGANAEILVILARHLEDNAVSAFIVETGWEGIEIAQRSHFSGLKAIENGLFYFRDVRIPAENLLGERGKGLAVAMTVLANGRASIPACAAGTAKMCLEIARNSAVERKNRWQHLGHQEKMVHQVADIAAATFALDAIANLTTAMYEKKLDIYLETALAKIYNSETLRRLFNDTLQIRGINGYEKVGATQSSNERNVPIEKLMRDWRVFSIIDGSNEMIRQFIARETLDIHSSNEAGENPPVSEAMQKSSGFYARWYLKMWLKGRMVYPRHRKLGRLGKHARFTERIVHKLARQIAFGKLWHGKNLEKRQAFAGRVVDIGAELLALIAVISRAHSEFQQGNRNAVNIADIFCRQTRRRIEQLMRELWKNDDRAAYKLGRQVMDKQFTWLEVGSAGISRTPAAPPKSFEDDPEVAKILNAVFSD